MLGEILQVRREPENIVDKFAVCVEKDDRVVGHLKKGDSGKFAKPIFISSEVTCIPNAMPRLMENDVT